MASTSYTVTATPTSGSGTSYTATITVKIDPAWVSVTGSISSASLNFVYFLDTSNAIIVAAGGKIAKSTDGGSSWTNKTSGTTEALTSVIFSGATGWAVGHSGVILKTTNGGTNWSTQTSGTAIDLYSISAINTTKAWIVGSSYGRTLYTSNDGSTWTQQTNSNQNGLGGVFFIDENTGYSVGACNSINATTNGGTTWTESQRDSFCISSNSMQLNSVHFVSSTIGLAVGYGGTFINPRIYKYIP